MKPAVVVLFLAVILSACGGGKIGSTVPVESKDMGTANLIPWTVGQKWDMRDQAGELTHFEVQAFPAPAACLKGTFINLHIGKDSPEPYPDAGGGGFRINQADWVFQKSQGSFRLVSFMWSDKANGFFNTWQVVGNQYWMLNPSAEGSITFTFSYSIAQLKDLRSCMTPEQVEVTGNAEAMTLTDTWDRVRTPVYSGPALRHEFCEQDHPPVCDRAHEVWWYAPNLGVVQIEILGPNTADGPIGYTTKRIN